MAIEIEWYLSVCISVITKSYIAKSWEVAIAICLWTTNETAWEKKLQAIYVDSRVATEHENDDLMQASQCNLFLVVP